MKNPFPELMTDEVFAMLLKKKLIRYVYVRNYQIRKDYKELRRTTNNRLNDNLKILRNKYFLSEETIKLIIYTEFFSQKLNEKNRKNKHNKK